MQVNMQHVMGGQNFNAQFSPNWKFLTGLKERVMSQITKKANESNVVPVRRRMPSSLADMDDMFTSMFPRMWARPFEGGAFEGAIVPKVDIIDEKDQVRVRVEAPGVKKEDLDVSVNDHTLTLKGRTSSKEESKEADYYRCEIHQGEFSRTVTLPAEVDGDNAKAKLKDGVLELILPKLEQSKRRAIKID